MGVGGAAGDDWCQNRLPLHEYPQCPGLREALQRIQDDPKLTPEQKQVQMKACVSDPDTCPLGLEHPANDVEFSLGCALGCVIPADVQQEEAQQQEELEAARQGPGERWGRQ